MALSVVAGIISNLITDRVLPGIGKSAQSPWTLSFRTVFVAAYVMVASLMATLRWCGDPWTRFGWLALLVLLAEVGTAAIPRVFGSAMLESGSGEMRWVSRTPVIVPLGLVVALIAIDQWMPHAPLCMVAGPG